MSAAQKWVICEASGRWAAAIRVMFARSDTERRPQLYETRSLAELSQQVSANPPHLVLVEVGLENLSAVVQILLRDGRLAARFVALLSEPNDGTSKQSIADLLWEFGATETVASLRQLDGLLALHRRLAMVRSHFAADLTESHSFADWARSTLPWQAT